MGKSSLVALTTGVFLSCVAPSGALEIPKRILLRLAAEEFQSRESAQMELLSWSRERRAASMKELLRQSELADDPEIRKRCREVLRSLVIDEYLKDGSGYIGIVMNERPLNVPGVAGQRYGIDIQIVVPESPAADAGLLPADTIVALGGRFWTDPGARESLAKEVQSMKPSSKVVLKILRGENLLEIPVVLGRMPPKMNGQDWNPEASDRAAKEAFFRDWLARQKRPE